MMKYLDIITKFFLEDIWRLRFDQNSKWRPRLIRTTRIFILAGRRFMTDDCQLKASALTFYSLLSVVPVVALAFGIAKGFGFREALELELTNRMVGHEEVGKFITEFALSYLDNAKGGMIAGVGVILLFWSVMKVLGNIEQSFNDIWDIKHSRSLVRKFSDYISFMLVATILLVSSSSVMIFITNSIEGLAFLKFASPVVLYAFPYFMVWIVFTLMFMLMPNTKVKLTSALFGGIIAGSLFIGLQFAYIYFQVAMSSYNAIYGSFAALPLFLMWMQASWLIVLFGAEFSFAHQNERSFEFEADTRNMSIFYRRLVSLLVVKKVVDLFRDEQPAPTLTDLTESLKIPVRLVSEVMHKLVQARIMVEVSSVGETEATTYLPAFAIDKMSVVTIVDKLEHHGASDFHFEVTDDYKTLRAILESFDRKKIAMEENVLLRDL
jgi:membrane protein